MDSDQFKPKSYLKLNKKYVFSEGEQFPLMTAEAGVFIVISTSRLVQGASDQITAQLVKKKNFTERVIPYVKLCILSRPRNRAKLSQSLWMLGEGTPRPRLFHSTIQGEQNGYFAHPSDFQGEQVLTLLTLFRSPWWLNWRPVG